MTDSEIQAFVDDLQQQIVKGNTATAAAIAWELNRQGVLLVATPKGVGWHRAWHPIEPAVEPKAVGEGTFTPPAFTPADELAIRQRADLVQDQQIKTDLFRLLAEIDRLRTEK
jgi:hypothetical protein